MFSISCKQDTIWILGLYGTAIGAGTLFLPINAGLGGIWPLIMIAMLAFPLTYFSHRSLCYFVLAGSKTDSDITEVVVEHFGRRAGNLITFLYLIAIYPILLVYSVAITNTVLSMLCHQLHLTISDSLYNRAIISLLLLLILMTTVTLGGDKIVKAMSMLVYPFIAALMGLAIYLIPNWNFDVMHGIGNWRTELFHSSFYKTLWLTIPVMVFAFNHSPIISSFSVAAKRIHPHHPERAANRVLIRAHLLMVFTVMFFVFSCVFCLSAHDLQLAKQQNISILSYLANHFDNHFIAWGAPILAIVAITKSFLGHYLGAKEGLNGLMARGLQRRNKEVKTRALDFLTAGFMFITCWLTATFNPNILTLIETLGGPIIAILLFLMPLYAVYTVPSMQKYRRNKSNMFILMIAILTLSALIYNLLE